MQLDLSTKIIELYTVQKISACKIAISLNITVHAVYYHLKKNNILRRKNSENSRKYQSDEKFFQSIDSESKAYWLGFIYADGYITGSSLGITLSEKDKNHLEKFSRSIGSTYPIHTYVYSGYKDVLASRVIIKSNMLVDSLITHGCYYNKSLILRWPTTIPHDLMSHFVRGYMDGDGSIYISKIKYGSSFKLRFEGTKEFLEGLMDFFKINLTLQKRNHDNKNSFTLDIGGNKKVLEKLDILYRDATIFLDRKYERYKLLQSLYPVIDKVNRVNSVDNSYESIPS